LIAKIEMIVLFVILGFSTLGSGFAKDGDGVRNAAMTLFKNFAVTTIEIFFCEMNSKLPNPMINLP